MLLCLFVLSIVVNFFFRAARVRALAGAQERLWTERKEEVLIALWLWVLIDSTLTVQAFDVPNVLLDALVAKKISLEGDWSAYMPRGDGIPLNQPSGLSSFHLMKN